LTKPPRPESDPLTYTANSIDRAALSRTNSAHVQRLMKSGAARFAPIWNQRHPVTDEPRAIIFTYEEATKLFDLETLPVTFLGLDNGTPWFAIGLPATDAPPTLNMDANFVILNEVVGILPAQDATLLAYARAMSIWHSNHLHCGRCGSPTKSTESGHSRTCSNSQCGYRSFPRTDPAVITLVTDGKRCLLGRQAQWPAGMYSTIAGFVEPGETLEQTVRREVREETGIEVGDVRYIASQPWPFPSSIMLGFRGQALSTNIHRDDDELEDCRWFTRAELNSFGDRNDGGSGFKLPGRYSIARYLIEDWRRDSG